MRKTGFYWVQIEGTKRGWEPAHWQDGCWITYDGPMAMVYVVKVGSWIALPPDRMHFDEVREQ